MHIVVAFYPNDRIMTRKTHSIEFLYNFTVHFYQYGWYPRRFNQTTQNDLLTRHFTPFVFDCTMQWNLLFHHKVKDQQATPLLDQNTVHIIFRTEIVYLTLPFLGDVGYSHCLIIIESRLTIIVFCDHKM